MSILDGLALGISGLSDPMVVLMLALGSLLGTLVGALPGLGAVTGCALLLPVAYSMETPQQGMSLLCAIYLGNMFGGRITAILINVPGDAAAVVTAFDGYPMMQAGRGGAALGISAISSFFGGFVSFILLAAIAQPLAMLALNFGPPEYTAVILFGFAAVVGLAEKQYLRSLLTMTLGMIISIIGADFMTAARRYVYIIEMYDGVEFAIVALGVFGVSEIMVAAETIPSAVVLRDANKSLTLRTLLPSWQEIKMCLPSICRGTMIGSAIGFLPGAGGTIATFVAYSAETSIAKDPSQFGKGSIIGVAAPEAANNSSVGGAIIPMLALGIPGSSTTAILLGAMMMFGLQTGPRVFETSAPIVWTMIVGLFVANFMLLLCNTLLIPVFVKLIDIGQRHLKPMICAAAMIGTFAISYGTAKMYICVGFGILGYIFKKLKYPPGPFLLSLVLFPKLEVTFRQALIMSKGDFRIFFRGPLAITFLLLSVLAFVYPLMKDRIASKKGSLADAIKGVESLENALDRDNE